MAKGAKDCGFKAGAALKYAKGVLGYSVKPRASMYEIVCEALERDGFPRPLDINCKQWALDHVQHINQRHRVFKRAQSARKKAGNASGSTTVFVPRRVDPKSDLFLSTFEWRKLRMEALKKHGATCQCCGASRLTGAVIHVDHIKPRKYYPELALDINNLQVLCDVCNHGKGNWDETDWR